MFGLTEAFRSTYLDPDKLDVHPTSIGKAIPDCQVMVLDEHGEECAPNAVGELVHRGATVTKGYWRDPENTAKVFRAHPRFPGEILVFSGDRAYRDEEGSSTLSRRADEMIKTKGFRVSPTEVETEVVRHPDVVDAVAFAVPNIAVGEDIACAYTTGSGKALPDHRPDPVPEDAVADPHGPGLPRAFSTAFPLPATPGNWIAKRSSRRHSNGLGIAPDVKDARAGRG